MVRKLLMGCVCAATVCSGMGMPLWADTLKLKDGTEVDGRVMDAGTSYWVKGADGKSQTIPKDSVQQWIKADAPATPAAASAGSLAGRGQAAAVPAGAPFAAVKAKADKVDTPIQAVALWQTFIDNHPSPADATAAKQQLAYWKQLVDGNGERINGKWIWGADRDKLLKQVRELLAQAVKDIDGNQTLNGIKELEEAVKLYPNDFQGSFLLGCIQLEQGGLAHSNAKMDAGLKWMESAVKLRPNCAEALSDLAVAYNFKGRYVQAVETAYRAAKITDNKEIVTNLIFTIVHAPPGIRTNTKIKTMVEEAMLLARTDGVNGEGNQYYWVRPPDIDRHHKADDDGTHDDSEERGAPGIIGNGSGELVSADGYILTNRHVAKAGDYLMVRLSDGTMKVADRVVIDDDQDFAIIKIKTDAPLPYVRLAPYDHPPVGEDVDVFGFPLLGYVAGLNSSVKMTRGIVTAWDEDHPMCDVTVDANINPGNSGGPMVDHYGNLLAITTAKTTAGNIEGEASISSYGMGQSTGRLRKFLTKQAAKLSGLKLEKGTTDKTLTNEELATKMTPITVCVFICRGAAPTGDATPKPPAQP